MLPTVLVLHSDTSRSLFMWKQNSLRRGAQTSKFEQDVLEPKDHLLMLIAAAAQRVVVAMKIQSNYLHFRVGPHH